MDSRSNQLPEQHEQQNHQPHIAPAAVGAQQQQYFQWPYPFYPVPPNHQQQQAMMPAVQQTPPTYKRKSRRHRRAEAEKEGNSPHQAPVPLPLPVVRQEAQAQGQTVVQQPPLPMNHRQQQQPVQLMSVFPQRQFYQDPSQFYNEQMLRNHRNAPSPEVLSQNQSKLREFKRTRKKQKRKERKKKAWEAQQRIVPQQLPFPGAPSYIRPPQHVNLALADGANQQIRPQLPMNMAPLPGMVPMRDNVPPRKRIKAEKSATSEYRGVSWSKRDGGYVARIWVRGKSETIGVFAEELRASVAVDERLIQLGVDDQHLLNFRTQLERDIALVILLNNHKNRQKLKTSEQKSVAHALASLGHSIPPIAASRHALPPGVSNWPAEGELTDISHKMLNKGVTCDNNGNPNSVRSVLKNILKRSGDGSNPINLSRTGHEEEKRHKPRCSSKRLSRGKKHRAPLSSRRRKAKKFKMQQPFSGNGMVGNTLTINTPAREKKPGEQSSDGYVGDGEDIAGAKRKETETKNATIEKTVVNEQPKESEKTLSHESGANGQQIAQNDNNGQTVGNTLKQ